MWCKWVVNPLLYTHLFIGACAALLVYSSFWSVGYTWHPFVLFSFCGTIWVYHLHRTVGILRTTRTAWPARYLLFYRYKKVNIIGSICTAGIGLWLFVSELYHYWMPLSVPVLLSLLYVVPIGQKRIVRNIPYIKIIFIALTWTWVSLILPLWIAEEQLTNHFGRIAERFIYIFAITIPFDIRDIKQDRSDSVPTLIHLLGQGKARYLAIGLLLLACGIAITLQLTDSQFDKYAFAHLPVYIVSAVAIWYSRENNTDYYYSLLIDGSMILCGLLELYVITSTF